MYKINWLSGAIYPLYFYVPNVAFVFLNNLFCEIGLFFAEYVCHNQELLDNIQYHLFKYSKVDSPGFYAGVRLQNWMERTATANGISMVRA